MANKVYVIVTLSSDSSTIQFVFSQTRIVLSEYLQTDKCLTVYPRPAYIERCFVLSPNS